MADLADQAYEEEEKELDEAVANALEPPAGCEAGPDWIDGVAHCRRCHNIIPEARLRAVPCTGLCVNCAALIQENQASTI